MYTQSMSHPLIPTGCMLRPSSQGSEQDADALSGRAPVTAIHQVVVVVMVDEFVIQYREIEQSKLIVIG